MEEEGISVYDFNKQIYGQMTPFTEEKLDAELGNVCAWMGTDCGRRYFMLNNYELHWFTLFRLGDKRVYHDVFRDLKEVLGNIGAVLAVEYDNEMGYYEIWVRAAQDGDVHMFVLFACDNLVIETR